MLGLVKAGGVASWSPSLDCHEQIPIILTKKRELLRSHRHPQTEHPKLPRKRIDGMGRKNCDRFTNKPGFSGGEVDVLESVFSLSVVS